MVTLSECKRSQRSKDYDATSKNNFASPCTAGNYDGRNVFERNTHQTSVSSFSTKNKVPFPLACGKDSMCSDYVHRKIILRHRLSLSSRFNLATKLIVLLSHPKMHSHLRYRFVSRNYIQVGEEAPGILSKINEAQMRLTPIRL